MSFHDLVQKEIASHGAGSGKLPLERGEGEGEVESGFVDTVVSEDGTETAILDGSGVPVVKVPAESDGYTDEQRRQVSEVYLAIAGLMPTEGRDYVVDFRFEGPSRGPKVSFHAKTPIGRAFIAHLAQNLGKAVKK